MNIFFTEKLFCATFNASLIWLAFIFLKDGKEMNKERRKRVNELIEKAYELNCEIEEILNEEQECFDNMPENLQYSERGETMQEAINSLEEAQSCIDDCKSYLESLIEY